MGFNGLTMNNNPVLNDSITSLENPFLNDKYKACFVKTMTLSKKKN